MQVLISAVFATRSSSVYRLIVAYVLCLELILVLTPESRVMSRRRAFVLLEVFRCCIFHLGLVWGLYTTPKPLNDETLTCNLIKKQRNLK